MTERGPGSDLLSDAKDELAGMARDGVRHPSTKPVLTGAAIGGVAGLVLPVLSIPLGIALGAGVMFYKRLRP